MENEIERIRTDQERDIRDEINKLMSLIEESKLHPNTIATPDVLLFLGHIVSIIGSEWGTMQRMLRILESQQALLTQPYGGNGVTLKEIFEQGSLRKRLMQKILGVALVAVVSIALNMLLNYSSEREANKKRDQMIQLLLEQRK